MNGRWPGIGIARAAGGLWTPLDSPLVNVWVDTSDAPLIQITNGRVSQITGKGPRVLVFTQGNAASQPVIKSTTGIGYNWGDAPGTQGLSLTLPGSPHFTVAFSVVSHDRPASDFTASTSAAMTTRRINTALSTNEQYIHVVGSSPTGYDVSVVMGSSTDNFLSSFVRVNGTAQSPADALWSAGVPTTDFNFMVAGTNWTGFTDSTFTLATDPIGPGRQWWGSVYQFVGCTSAAALNDTDLHQRLEGWAAHKYGQQATLPAGHPYKSAPPTK
jgi:hypothetical protein